MTSKKDISIIFENKTEMPFEADEYLLRRLFTNLIDNAIKHTSSKVIIETVKEDKVYRNIRLNFIISNKIIKFVLIIFEFMLFINFEGHKIFP